MHKTLSTTTSRRRPIAVMILAVAASATPGGNLAASKVVPPPWDQCAYRDHPVAADAGAVLAWNAEVSDELRLALRGEIAVGTDCSIYDLPV